MVQERVPVYLRCRALDRHYEETRSGEALLHWLQSSSGLRDGEHLWTTEERIISNSQRSGARRESRADTFLGAVQPDMGRDFRKTVRR